GNGVAQRTQQAEPLVECLDARLVRLAQPVVVIRKVELARAAGNGAAMLDGAQELRIAQRLEERRAGVVQLGAQAYQIREHGLEPAGVDTGLRLELVERADLTFELFQYIRPDVAARRDRQHVQQARHGSSAAPLARDLVVIQG